MKKTGAWLVRHALEALPVSHTFGIPGMQNTAIYDELDSSPRIRPLLVTHEGGASFAADGLSRSSDRVGVCLLVPGAGISNAMSGICEALVDGVPLLVLAGAPRLDSGKSYQLHQIDTRKLVAGAVKGSWHPASHAEIVPAIFEAFRLATSGCPGPVLVEIPAELQLFEGEVGDLPAFVPAVPRAPEAALIAKAVALLKSAKRPGIFAGWGCRDAADSLRRVAELLEAPVSLTMQGYGVFEGTHPLHAGFGFGPSAVPAARKAFEGCDCLLAVGTRFSEVGTGSFGLPVPADLIHIDADASVFDKNYKSSLAIEADAGLALEALASALKAAGVSRSPDTSLRAGIAEGKAAYHRSWLERKHDGVNPARFLRTLSEALGEEGWLVTDIGNHAFLVAEHYVARRAGRIVAPCDFNCMGYAVPAAIGVKLANPGVPVAAVVGDGAFLMTGNEMLTARANGLGIVYCLFHDGELAQISQAQVLPYNRKTCTVLPDFDASGIALATGAAYIELVDDAAIEIALGEALAVAEGGRPVVLDIRMDYSKKTNYTKGVVSTNLARFPTKAKVSMIAKALVRRLPFGARTPVKGG